MHIVNYLQDDDSSDDETKQERDNNVLECKMKMNIF